MRITEDLIPKCPVWGKNMTMNLRSDHRFVEDEGWQLAQKRYEAFLLNNKDKGILYLELGVGYNTPVIIKYPFWNLTAKNKKAVYAYINNAEATCPIEIKKQSICIDDDIGRVLRALLALR
ncbi:hypothetical protein Q5O14_17300 [Eubacteriaceae bacterium ES2]|nr:hypothetical protein Q5O14_17300 [Eubacteriaceae bacterium ES2]